MKLIFSFFIFILLHTYNNGFSQNKLQQISAKSHKIAIKDGEEGKTNYWHHLVKSKNPIIYHLAKNGNPRRVTFYTDVDSINIQVAAESDYPFKVILNGSDTCLVILTTKNYQYKRLSKSQDETDTLPFTLNKNKQIIIKGSINNSREMDFCFDLGARIVYVIGKNYDKLNKLTVDGFMEDESVTGLSTEKTSSNNNLQLGNLSIANVPICYIDDAGYLENGSGLIGHSIFQNKIIEIDFNNKLLLLHDKIPEKISTYAKIDFKQTTGGLYVPLSINNGKKISEGWFFFDTGADNTLTFDSRFVKKANLYNTMKVIGKAGIASSENHVINAKIVAVPEITIASFRLKNIPALMADESHAEAEMEDGVIGIGLQSRFNFIIDYPNSKMYLKPSMYFSEMSKKKDNNSLALFSQIGIFLSIMVFVLFLYMRRKSKLEQKNKTTIKQILFLSFAFVHIAEVATAQQNLPILKTNVPVLDVKEGGILQKGKWQLSTDIAIDVYEVNNKNVAQEITFYSDIDSITFKVKPNSHYDFTIELKGKSLFKSRISTKYNSYRKSCNDCIISSDTIPFKLGKGNRIMIKGKINDGEDLDFMFDTGAESIGLYKSGLKKNSTLFFNGSGIAIGAGGQFEIKNSSNNKLEISKLMWDDKSIYYSGDQLGKYDGIIGYKIFEDKVLELDFEKNIIVAHESLPDLKAEYTKCNFIKKDELFFIELKLKIGNKVVSDWFDFDTGNTGTINIHDEFAIKENIYNILEKKGESELVGADGNQIKTDKVILPKLFIGEYELKNIPIFVEQKTSMVNLPFSILGIELIHRFNIIIDYKNNCIYLKPNKYFLNTFKNKNETIIIIIGFSIALLVLGGLFFIYKSRNSKIKNLQ